jgi:glycosyltransferase involved in cell wall biosynthesis
VDNEAIDVARAQARSSASDATAVVGWVGSFTSWHGADILVRALTRLPTWVRAVLIGDGAERLACESLARDLGVAPRVEFTGTLAHTEAVQRLAECDLLASPHVPMPGQPFFGSPTKIFEYMAIGRPIVASALEQIAEILEDRRTAVLVAPGDPESLARGIELVAKMPDRGEHLGRAARLEAERRHTWDARVRVLLDRLSDDHGSSRADAVDHRELAHID